MAAWVGMPLLGPGEIPDNNPWPDTIHLVYPHNPEIATPVWDGPNAVRIARTYAGVKTPQQLSGLLNGYGVNVGNTLELAQHHMILHTPTLRQIEPANKDRLANHGLGYPERPLQVYSACRPSKMDDPTLFPIFCDATLTRDRMDQIQNHVLGDAQQQSLVFHFDGVPSFHQSFEYEDFALRLGKCSGIVALKDPPQIENKIEFVTECRQHDGKAIVLLMFETINDRNDVNPEIRNFFRTLCLSVGAVGVKLKVDEFSSYELLETVTNIIMKPSQFCGYGVGGHAYVGFFAINEGCSHAAKMVQCLHPLVGPQFNILIEPKFMSPLIQDDHLRDLGPVSRAPPTFVITGSDQVARCDCITYALKLSCLKKRCVVQLGNFMIAPQASAKEIQRFVLGLSRSKLP